MLLKQQGEHAALQGSKIDPLAFGTCSKPALRVDDKTCVSLQSGEKTVSGKSMTQLPPLQAIENECGALKREAPPGIEPGMADLQSAAGVSAAAEKQGVLQFRPKACEGLAKEREISTEAHIATELPADLAALVKAWDGLPTNVRRAILVLALAQVTLLAASVFQIPRVFAT